MIFKIGFWKDKSHFLDKMTLGGLVKAFFQYYSIQAYLLVAAISTYFALQEIISYNLAWLSIGVAIILYPLIWYIIHRWILHSQWMYKSSLTAKVWKRIHYDHHQDPHRLEILFGALYNTLPTIVIATFPIGYYIEGIGGGFAAVAAGMILTCINEFMHCIQHLNFKPKNTWLKRRKELHMMHHFHDEDGNFGITNFIWDKLFGTYYERGDRKDKSAKVFNLGYTEEMAAAYPWVSDLSGGLDNRSPRERRKDYKKSGADVNDKGLEG